jgi:phage-related protein
MNLEVKMRLRLVRDGKWRIVAICRERGECPLLDFLDGLPSNLEKDGRRMQALFTRIAAHGPPRSVELSHQIAPGLWQLSRGRLRVPWFYDEDRTIVLTHGFVKRYRTTPPAEIERAEARRDDYRFAKAGGELFVEEEP